MEKIEFQLFGLDLLEPIGFIMNLAISGLSFWIWRTMKSERQNSYIRSWRLFFLFFGLSGFFGGFSHLMYNYWGMTGKIPGFSFTILAISTLQWAMLKIIYPDGNHTMSNIIYALFVSAFTLLIYDLSFIWVAIHTAIGLLGFVGIPSFRRWFKGDKSLQLFALGVLSMLLAVPFEVLKIDFSIWFNHQDIAHVFMLITLYLFYRGALKVNKAK